MSTDQPAPSASSSSAAVPSPSTSFPTYLPHVSSILDAATTHAAALPDKSDLSFHRTLDRPFARGLDETSESVLKIAERLLELAVSAGKGKEGTKGKAKAQPAGVTARRRKLEDEDDVMDRFRSSVVDVVDGLLEDADSNLDEVNGAKKKAAINVKPSLAAAAGALLPGPFSSKDRLEANLILNRSMTKPQLHFSPPIDNSPSRPPWRPTLATKAHAMVPLDFVVPSEIEMPFSEDEEEVAAAADSEKAEKKRAAKRERKLKARAHPYFYETTHLPYPTSLFTQSAPIRPKDFDETPFEFVDTPEQLEAMVQELKGSKEIAIDLEHHNMRSYEGFTCLMQVSNRRADWVVDTLTLRSELRDGKLGGVMADPSIVKVFHGADSDILWLQQDFDIYVVNLFDTYHACKVLDFPKFSLASLLQLYCDFEADKRYQMADWRIRPLPKEMLFYARSDTHFLLYVFDNLRNALLAKSSRNPSPSIDADAEPSANSIPTPTPSGARQNPQQAMRITLARSAETALKMYERDEYDTNTGKGMLGWAPLAKKLGKREILETQIGWTFKRLHAWRDRVAREEDESPHYVLPNYVLVQLSHLRPKTVAHTLATIGKTADIATGRVQEIIEVINAACADFDAQETAIVPFGSNIKSSVPAVIQQSTGRVGPTLSAPRAQVAAPATKQSVYQTWAELQPATSTAEPTAGRRSTSALFGSTIAAPPAKGPAATRGSTRSSQLFGASLANTSAKRGQGSRGRMMSPGFEALQQSIYQGFVPAPRIVDPLVQAGAAHKPEPETVPFVPRAHRQPPPPPATEAEEVVLPVKDELADTKPALPMDEDGTVQVKKSRKQKKREKQAAAAAGSEMGIDQAVGDEVTTANGVEALAAPRSPLHVASMAEASQPAGSRKPRTKANAKVNTDSTQVKAEPSSQSQAQPPTKKPKIKVKPEDIPVFDYANQPSILDQPGSAKQSGKAISQAEKRKQKKEKEKNKKPVVDTSGFKRPPSDMTQPKAGNKSGTFKM